MKLAEQSMRARPLLEILNRFLESAERGLQSGVIDSAHGQNEIMSGTELGCGGAVDGWCFILAIKKNNTKTQTGFDLKKKKKKGTFYLSEEFHVLLAFSLQLDSVQNFL